MAIQKFEDIVAWQKSQDIAVDIYKCFQNNKDFGFRDQLFRASVSISNNIAEGSGSYSKKDFKQFLNMARRSTFENANILILLKRRSLITEGELEKLLDKLDHLCRQITNFQSTLI